MNNNFLLLMPEFLVTGLAFGVLTIDLFIGSGRKHWLAYLSAAGLLAILAFTLVTQWNTTGTLYSGVLRIDGYSLFFKGFFLTLGAAVMLSSVEYVKRHLDHPGEYYGILLFTILAGMALAMSGELLTAYIALELLSFGLYVLVSYDRYNPKSNEAGVKYIILGALSSAVMLYGISQVYGLLGTTTFAGISDALTVTGEMAPGVMIGLLLLIAGIGFKLAAVPFHMWAPDAYEGAPVPITAYLAVGSKAAAIALALRLFGEAFMPAADQWRLIVIVMAVATMVLGNVVALVQTNIKRLLAYSSIGHVGYLLMGIAALAGTEATSPSSLSLLASNGVMLHVVAYGVTNLAMFLGVSIIYDATGMETIRGMSGMARRAPFLGVVMAVALFSLAGLPIFAGFASKFYLFNAVATQGLLWLASIGVLTSLVSLYYYLMIVRQMYIEQPEETTPIYVPRLSWALLGVFLLAMVYIGVYPAHLMDAIQHASDALFAANSLTQFVGSLD